MSAITPAMVRKFLVDRYADKIVAAGFNVADLPDSFDLLTNDIVDSYGALDVVNALEQEFNIQIDMATFDPESLIVLGPISEFVAKAACNGAARPSQ